MRTCCAGSRSSARRCRLHRPARAADNPELAKLVRGVAGRPRKQIGAAVATLNNLLALPPAERAKKKALRATQAEIRRACRPRETQTLKEIARKFSAIWQSRQSAATETRSICRSNSPMTRRCCRSIFGRFDSFVWVVRKDSPVPVLRRIRMTLGDLNAQSHQAARSAGAESGDDIGHNPHST